MTDEPGRPRVLWLIKGLGPGGAEQLLVNQARVSDRTAIDLEVAYLVPWKDHHVAALQQLDVPVTCLDGPNDLDPRWAMRLRKLVVSHQIDIVHVHSPYVAAMSRLVVRSIPRARRPALVYTEHNSWARHKRSTRLLNRLTIALDDLDLTVSEDVRRSMSRSAASRAQVLVHGIDADLVRTSRPERSRVRSELGIPPDDDTVVVGIVANFRKEKGYDTWLRAVEIAMSEEPRLLFVSVGQGPLEQHTRAAVARSSAAPHIVVLGYRPDAIAIMAGFDVFTLTSRHEGLPVSLMDALALGLPVVATAVGGIPEAVDDGVEAILVPPDDPSALAAAYVDLGRDPGRRSAMARAAEARSADFDVVITQRRLEAAYRSTADRRRS